MLLFIVSFFLHLTNFCEGEIRISLNSDQISTKWMVANQNENISLSATVPGGIYTDLQTAGYLDDELFYRFNDINYRWIARENWTYSLNFDVPTDALKKRAVNLVFHGIDTVGEIFLNGNYLASVSNMFVRHVIPIKTLIKEKNNALVIRLKSPIHEANRLAELQKQYYRVPPECTPDSYNGECHVNFLRKMQASFSWDWGPAFPSMGIWKSVEIEAFDLAVLRDIIATPVKVNASWWTVKVAYHAEYASNEVSWHRISGQISIRNLNSGRELSIPGEFKVDHFKDPRVINGYVSYAQFFVPKENINLWWPNGLGSRELYNMTLSIKNEDETEFSSKTVKIGFRTLELVQEELNPGQRGLSFYFKINGVPFFAKGSNWIPGHILPEKGYDKSTIRDILQSAKDANMNMLRVWGGGVYESDTFYEIADELGILIWQDMMFACSMYPTNEEFLESVKTEIEQQVRRLQHHPSIALWAGNNENEAALRGNWYGTDTDFSLYREDYIKLYIDTIGTVIRENDNSREYVPSSPSNGIESIKEGYIAYDPYSPLFGDLHYYNYIFDSWIDYNYPDTRFASEYGFQSMPSFQTISKISLSSDRTFSSEFTKKRQHLPRGNAILIYLIERQFSLPQNVDSESFYKTFIYYSQISQAMGTKTETEKYRRDRNKLTNENKGNTMGAMYWQLNDVWQAPSWSSIEFGGKWKMLHYFAKKFFSPVLVSPERTPEDLINVFLISDLLYDIPEVQLTIYVYSWHSFTPVRIYSSNVYLNNNSAVIHSTYDLNAILKDSNCEKDACFQYFTVTGPNVFSDNVIFPSKFRDIKNLQKANLKVSAEGTANPAEAKVIVTTDRIAPFVWLETDECGEFSDNGFLLLNPTAELTFNNRRGQPIDVDTLKSTIKIRSI